MACRVLVACLFFFFYVGVRSPIDLVITRPRRWCGLPLWGLCKWSPWRACAVVCRCACRRWTTWWPGRPVSASDQEPKIAIDFLVACHFFFTPHAAMPTQGQPRATKG